MAATCRFGIVSVAAVLAAAAIAALITIVPEAMRAVYIQTDNKKTNEKNALEKTANEPLVPDVKRVPAPALASNDDQFRFRHTLDSGGVQTPAAGASYFVGSLSREQSSLFVAEPAGLETLRQHEAFALDRNRQLPSSDLAYNSIPHFSLPVRVPSAEANLDIPLPVSRPVLDRHGQAPDKSTPSINASTLAGPTLSHSFSTFAWLQKLFRFKDAQNIPMLPSEADSRTAVYDIKGHLVYLPGGEILEAHSGLGKWLDNARYVNVKDRGPTPPNVYRLALREHPFHGVQAIRLNPIGSGNMYGRKGMLAHPYMLGPNGQSNGCVSVQDYPKFLQAFLRGDINRLIVVADLAEVSSKAKYAQLGLMARDVVVH